MQDVVKQKNKTTRLLFPSLNYIDIEEGTISKLPGFEQNLNSFADQNTIVMPLGEKVNLEDLYYNYTKNTKKRDESDENLENMLPFNNISPGKHSTGLILPPKSLPPSGNLLPLPSNGFIPVPPKFPNRKNATGMVVVPNDIAPRLTPVNDYSNELERLIVPKVPDTSSKMRSTLDMLKDEINNFDRTKLKKIQEKKVLEEIRESVKNKSSLKEELAKRFKELRKNDVNDDEDNNSEWSS